MSCALTQPLNTNDLSDQIIQLYANINAATYSWLKLIAQFDAQHLAQQQGFISTAAWLGYYCGIGTTAAREKVRVARALGELPSVDAEFAAGRLSYSKVRALTRVATPLNEVQLLHIAQHATAHQLARVLRDYVRSTADRPAVAQKPELIWHEDKQGNLVFTGRFPAELGALMRQAIQRKVEERAEPGGSMAHQSAEALLALVQASDPFSDQAPDQAPGQAPGQCAEPAADEPAKPVSSADQYIVHVELNPAGAPAQLRSGQVLAQSAVERLTCDASLVGHTVDADGTPLDVGRKTRIVSAPLRRALHRRDKGCRFPGCTHSHFVDAHHVHHWAHGGETKLSNLILLCSRHHRDVHEGTVRVHAHHPEQGATQFWFYTAEGTRLLPTGDQQRRHVQPLAEVTAVTFKCGDTPTTLLQPENPQARPDYAHIAWYLAEHVPRR